MYKRQIYYLAYNVVFLVLILAGAWIGIFTLPVDWIGFAGWVAAMGLAGLTVGVIFGSIAMVWPFFLRTAPVIERALQIFSGVFFVSDQLPVEFRQYVLWSPFMHALELMRADYFGSYEPADANPQYFALCLGVLVCIAFAAERSLRSRSHPM